MYIDGLEDLSQDQLLQVQAKILGYKSVPPSIEEFVTNDYYLGKAFGGGGKDVYPYWMKILKEIYPTPIHTAHPFVVFTGPIGGGKSTITKIMNLYQLCRLGHLDNFGYFGVNINKTIDFVMCHTTSQKAQSDLVNGSWNIYEKSPYFTRDFQWSDSLYRYVSDGPRTNSAIGGDVIFYHFSEVNFIDFYKAKHKIDQAFDRYKSRFLRVLNYFGGIVIDSSAEGDESIVDYLIKEYPGLYVIRDPIWEIKKHLGIYFRKGSFKVYIGDSSNPPFIISDERPLTDDHDPDRVIEVPMELYENYKSDIVLSLQNTAGISTSSSDTFFTDKELLKEAFTIPNHIDNIITVDFFDDEELITQVKDQLKEIPTEKVLFIGVDMGVSSDLCGFSVSYFDDWVYKEGKKTIEFKTKTPLSIGISRKSGQETSITKVFNLIKSISEDYEIGAVVTDQYQSTQLRQDLTREGINSYLSSVDRSMDPYIFLKTQVYKGLSKFVTNKELEIEMFNLVNTGSHIDHLSSYSKDLSDALCNSVKAIKDNLDIADQISTKYSFDVQLKVLKQIGRKDVIQDLLKSRTSF